MDAGRSRKSRRSLRDRRGPLPRAEDDAGYAAAAVGDLDGPLAAAGPESPGRLQRRAQPRAVRPRGAVGEHKAAAGPQRPREHPGQRYLM